MASALLERIPVGVTAALARAVFALPGPVRSVLMGRRIRIDDQELGRDAQLLLVLQRLTSTTLAADTDPVRARAMLDASSQIVAKQDLPPVAVRDLELPGPASALPARLYTPQGAAGVGPLLVFFHGGGWVIGSLESHHNVCHYLAANGGLRVLSVGYRLAPEAPFPAAVDDALAAFRWAVRNAAELGADPNAIAVGGDSAGGNLAAVVSHLATRRRGPRPAFQLLFYPATDATQRRPSRQLFADGFFLTGEDIDWFTQHYAPDPDTASDPRMSPLLAPNLAGLPPAYITTAGFDPLRDEGEAYAARLAEAGVPVVLRRHPDLIHGFINFIGLGSRFTEALAEAVGALRTGLTISAANPDPATPVKKRTSTRKEKPEQ